MATNGSRFHIEVTGVKAEDEMSVRFNIFGDTLAQVTADLEQVMAYVTGQEIDRRTAATAAQCVIANEKHDKMMLHQAKVSAAAAAAAPPKPPPPTAKTGACIGCGSDALEWVTGMRKDNGKPFAAYKCQECGKWQPEAKK